MTEDSIKDIFFKNYSGCDLNEALMASIEEITLTIIKEGDGQSELLPEIVETIAMAKSRLALFGRTKGGVSFAVPIGYLTYFDQIQKAMSDVIRYTRDNLELMNPWFREQFSKEDLEMMSIELSSAIERLAERPDNVRTFHSEEFKIYEKFFTIALVGIMGQERFLKYAEEYNRHANTLRQCQIECRAFSGKVGMKES